MTQAQANANAYLRNRVLGANPLQLRLMLFDGAIKFCRQAVDAIGREDWEGMYTGLIKAQKIVMELNTSLKHDQSPDLCARLAALYTYIYRRLVDANLERDETPVNESIGLLEYERETWQMLMEKSAQGDPEPAPDHPIATPGTPQSPTNPVGRIGPDEPTSRLSVDA
jgi:flagellar protein FliS